MIDVSFIISLAIFAGDTVSLIVRKDNASVDGKWDPVSGQGPNARYIKVSAGEGVELRGDGRMRTNIGCLDVEISPNDKQKCETSCVLNPDSSYHKLHTSGHYRFKGGEGEGTDYVWNATGRTTEFNVTLSYKDGDSIKTVQFDVEGKANLTIEGDLKGEKIKLIGDGVKILDPDREYTSSAEFRFIPDRISAAQNDISISAVDSKGNTWDKLNFTSYLYYVPSPQPCLKQRKDTDTVCERCPDPANLKNHDGDKPHPDDYDEIRECNHCNNNCARAVIVSMGKKKFQDEVFKRGTKTLTDNHGEGIDPEELDYLKIIQGVNQQLFAEKIYLELQDSKRLFGEIRGRPSHAVLVWGTSMNTEDGKITPRPTLYFNDPFQAGSFQSELKAVFK